MLEGSRTRRNCAARRQAQTEVRWRCRDYTRKPIGSQWIPREVLRHRSSSFGLLRAPVDAILCSRIVPFPFSSTCALGSALVQSEKPIARSAPLPLVPGLADRPGTPSRQHRRNYETSVNARTDATVSSQPEGSCGEVAVTHSRGSSAAIFGTSSLGMGTLNE